MTSTLFLFLTFFATVFAIPANIKNPDSFMYNDGMLGGDIAGGYEIVTDEDGKTAIIPSSNYVFWPNSVMYYEIHESLADHRDIIMSAMDEYHENTCLRFEERNGDESIENYVLLRGDISGCSSYKGMRVSGFQEVKLHVPGCIYKGTIMHELMHAAGFWHEHQRFDRNDYVRIAFENVEAGKEHNFDIADLTESQNVGDVSYNFDSIMHYELTAFSVNDERTIVPIGEFENEDPGNVWNQNYMSQGDIDQINAVYC
ncbi:unnamed protein product [Notodromas monacha]|uniref:Metalloendopeptidase n=1 Tax=Notodromas monacha TaxID=399045 RepID=A0A7R9BJU5_9CRUS|nr:unnamed protein product [Notodromas monacha]CAG0915470.1 unnamed protein product [Notodromas monacha]